MQKKKSGVKKCLEILPLKGWGGVGPLMANAILNFHFDFLHPSLSGQEDTLVGTDDQGSQELLTNLRLSSLFNRAKCPAGLGQQLDIVLFFALLHNFLTNDKILAPCLITFSVMTLFLPFFASFPREGRVGCQEQAGEGRLEVMGATSTAKWGGRWGAENRG